MTRPLDTTLDAHPPLWSLHTAEDGTITVRDRRDGIIATLADKGDLGQAIGVAIIALPRLSTAFAALVEVDPYWREKITDPGKLSAVIFASKAIGGAP